MCRIFLISIILAIFFNIKLHSEDLQISPVEIIKDLKLLKENEICFYYEIDTNFYAFNTPVRVIGFYDSKNREKDWFVILSIGMFNMPICYYLDSCFYYIDIQNGKINCVSNSKYKMVLNMKLSLPVLEIVQINKSDNDSSALNFQDFFVNKKIEIIKNVDKLKLIAEDEKYPDKYYLTLNSNYTIQSFEIIVAKTFLNFKFTKISDESKINKIKQLRSKLVSYLAICENSIERKSSDTTDKMVTFQKVVLLRTFITTHFKIYSPLQLKKQDGEKLDGDNQDLYLKSFNILYFEFLKFLQKDQNYKKWYDLINDF